jgi:hypothetical protein
VYSSQSNFEYEYLGEFETEFENILGYESGDHEGSIDEKIRGRQSRATIPLIKRLETKISVHCLLNSQLMFKTSSEMFHSKLPKYNKLLPSYNENKFKSKMSMILTARDTGSQRRWSTHSVNVCTMRSFSGSG